MPLAETAWTLMSCNAAIERPISALAVRFGEDHYEPSDENTPDPSSVRLCNYQRKLLEPDFCGGCTAAPKQKQPATVSRGGLFQFVHRDEEYPSFAGLAATYSSKS
jgi:hypothetical protein